MQASGQDPFATAERERVPTVVVTGWMEHVKDHAGSKGARGMALMGGDMKHLARLQDVGGRQRL